MTRVTISLPDDLFRMGEAAARRLHVSRSELYARAIEQFLKQQDEDAITELLNAIYSRFLHSWILHFTAPK